MNLDLHGHTALVSGSTVGIGLANAQGLAAQGALVIVNGRTQSRVDEAVVVVKCSVTHAEVFGVAEDLSTAQGVKRVVDVHPRLDVLVNNLGIFGLKPFEQIDDAE